MTLLRPTLLVAIALSVLIVHPDIGSWNDASRMATVQALVEHGTFSIDQTEFVDTGDKVLIDGRFYSTKPPLPALIGAVVYTPLYYLGLNLSYGPSAAYYLITLLTMKVALLVALWCFYIALRRTDLNNDFRLLAVGALALASLMLPWTSVFNNHALAACFVTIGFLAVLNARHRSNPPIWIAVAGFFLSLAAVSDLSTVAIYVAFGLYTITAPALRRCTALYLLPCLVTVAPYLLFNFQISGGVMPVQSNAEFYIYPGSPWTGGTLLSGANINAPRAIAFTAWSYLFGPNGFVLYNPLLFIAIPLALMEVWSRRAFWREAVAILIAASVILSYYAMMTINESGSSYSIRWFVPLLPLFYFFLYPFLENLTRLRAQAFGTLFAISAMIAAVGVLDPWSDKDFYESALLYNLGLDR